MTRTRFLARQLVLLLLCFTISGCATMCKELVPPGHVGMCRTAQGFSGQVLSPGYHECWGSDSQMYYIEVTDYQQVINMSVLCKDSLNFKFDVSVLSSVERSNQKLLRKMFENVTPRKGTTITATQIFKTYAQNAVDQEARKVVSKYETSEIVGKRKEILEELQGKISDTLKGSIITVKRVTVNNLDFPEVVTRAQEERAKRQVEIETEKAEQRKRLLKAQNALKISELEYKQQLLEAAMIADSNAVIGSSITPQYLAWWQLKTMSEAAQGPNNWGFIPYTDFTNNKANMPKQVLNEALRIKIQKARESVETLNFEEDAPKE